MTIERLKCEIRKLKLEKDVPNVKWVTDITEFSIPAGKVYLSPIIDCFDGLVVSWSIGTSPDADLVNSMLDQATKTLKDEEYPILHSDRGTQYPWPGQKPESFLPCLERGVHPTTRLARDSLAG